MTHQSNRQYHVLFGFVTLVCFTCRYTAKEYPIANALDRKCPFCQVKLRNLGKNAKIPDKSNTKKWNILRNIYLEGKDPLRYQKQKLTGR